MALKLGVRYEKEERERGEGGGRESKGEREGSKVVARGRVGGRKPS